VQQLVLKDLEVLMEILSVEPFDLGWLQKRCESLVKEWNEQCFGKKPPTLVALGYHPLTQRTLTKRGGRRSAPARLQERDSTPHRSLFANPLEASREREEQATGISPAARKKKKRRLVEKGAARGISMRSRTESVQRRGSAAEERTGQALTATKGGRSFDDSNNEVEKSDTDSETENRQAKSKLVLDYSDDEEEELHTESEEENRRERACLSKLPEHRNATGVASKRNLKSFYPKPPPDEGIFDRESKAAPRQMWTDDETNALLAGLERYGAGRWAQIKNAYKTRLRNRTPCQLKDKYRNMKGVGDLPDEGVP
jgi:hypothetical protein